MAYVPIANSEIDPDSPITTSLMTKMRDNPEAIAAGLTGAPRIVQGALSSGVQAQLVTNGNSHNHDGGDGAQIPSGGLADNAVITSKILNANVTPAKLAADVGAWIELSAQNVTNVTWCQFTSLLVAGYDVFKILFFDINFGTGANSFAIQLGVGGAYQTAGNYYYGGAQNGVTYSGTGQTYMSLNSTVIQGTEPNRAQGEVMIYSPRSGDGNRMVTWHFSHNNAATAYSLVGAGGYHSTSVFDSLRIGNPLVANMTGKFRLYGLKT